MNELISKALAEVPLQPGRTYYTTVGCNDVVVVVSEGKDLSHYESMIMLDLAINFPDPTGGRFFEPEEIADELPYPISIPEDGEAP